MGHYADEMQNPEPRKRSETEQQIYSAMQFIRVSTRDGYLTEWSVAQILVELKKSGFRLVRDGR